MTRLRHCIATTLLVCVAALSVPNDCQSQRIAFWNVENFFDTRNDSVDSDDTFTPAGDNHWTLSRFQHKRDNLYKVILDMGSPAIVGLAEVENSYVLAELTNGTPLRKLKYRFIHYDSPDHRGIDCAMIYRTDIFSPLYSFPVSVSDSTYHTRDLLFVFGHTNSGDTLALVVCHLPSKLGGATAEKHRSRIATILQHSLDTLSIHHPSATIIVMGDFNADRYEPQFRQDFGFLDSDTNKNGFHNLTYSIPRMTGTHNYGGRWSCIDQILIKPSPDRQKLPKLNIFRRDYLLEYDKANLTDKPYRTYVGLRYLGGFSDHLPIFIDL